MLRSLLLLLAVAAVAGLAAWGLSAGPREPVVEPAVVPFGEALADAPAGSSDPHIAPMVAPRVEAEPLQLTVDPFTAAWATRAEHAPVNPRFDRIDRARLRWDDGAPVVGAVVDVAVGEQRTPYGELTRKDPPAVTSDADGRLLFRQLYAGRPHLAIVNHRDLVGVVGLPFEVPSAEESWPEPLELVVPRPSTLVVDGLDPARQLTVRLLDQASDRALLQRDVEGASSTTFEGLPRGAVIDAVVRAGSSAHFAGGRATMDADVVQLTVIQGRTPEEASRPGFAWRLVDRRGELLTHDRLRDAGLEGSPQATLVGADASVSQQALTLSGKRYLGWLSPEQPPPWQLSFTLLGGESDVYDIEPGDEVTLVAPAGVLEDGGAVLHFAAIGSAGVLLGVDLTSTSGERRSVFARSDADGRPPEARVVVPPGDYSWRAWGATQGYLDAPAVHGDVRVTWAEVGTARQIEVPFAEPGSLSGSIAFAGGVAPSGGRVVLLPRVASMLPDPPSAAFGSDHVYRLTRLGCGDYDIVVHIELADATVAVPAGRVQVSSGETIRDLELSLPEPRTLRRLTVTSKQGSEVLLVLSDGRGRRFTYALDLDARFGAMVLGQGRARQLGAEDAGGLIPSSLPTHLTLEQLAELRTEWQRWDGTLDVPVGLDRYEAWVGGPSRGWYVSGFLEGDELALARDGDGRVLTCDDDD